MGIGILVRKDLRTTLNPIKDRLCMCMIIVGEQQKHVCNQRICPYTPCEQETTRWQLIFLARYGICNKQGHQLIYPHDNEGLQHADRDWLLHSCWKYEAFRKWKNKIKPSEPSTPKSSGADEYTLWSQTVSFHHKRSRLETRLTMFWLENRIAISSQSAEPTVVYTTAQLLRKTITIKNFRPHLEKTTKINHCKLKNSSVRVRYSELVRKCIWELKTNKEEDRCKRQGKTSWKQTTGWLRKHQ